MRPESVETPVADEQNAPDQQKLSETTIGQETAEVFYSNHVNVSVSPWDMRLMFSQVVKVDPGTGVTYKTVATIYLAPGQARALRKLLVKKAEIHESIWAKADEIIDGLVAASEPAKDKE